MDGTTAGKVEGREIVQPTLGVPSPAGDRAVDDGGPDETEDEAGDDLAALKGAADDDHDGAGAEHELVEAEDNVGEVGAADAGGGRDVLHAEVGQVADERGGGAGEGE